MHDFHCALKFCSPHTNSRTHEFYSRRSRHSKKIFWKICNRSDLHNDRLFHISLIRHLHWLRDRYIEIKRTARLSGVIRSNNRIPFIKTSFYWKMICQQMNCLLKPLILFIKENFQHKSYARIWHLYFKCFKVDQILESADLLSS